jgi:DUF971 family protein
VDLDRDSQLLSIAWEDGHRSGYAAGMLRWACPCAECRGEGYGTVGRLEKVTELPQADLELEAVTLVGRYALQLGFRSGHSTGIYTFRHLRAICPCADCRRSGAPTSF